MLIGRVHGGVPGLLGVVSCNPGVTYKVYSWVLIVYKLIFVIMIGYLKNYYNSLKRIKKE